MKRIRIIVAFVAALLVMGSSVALAAIFEIPIETVVYAPEGSITRLETVETPPELIGASCIGVAVAANQTSVHPGNDLIISSGGTSVVLEDVERAPGTTTPASGSVTLGETVTVDLRMGPDEVFSGGLVIIIDSNCTPPTTVPPTTTPPTTEPPPTTTPPDPQIQIIKTATPEFYGADGIGYFTIEVINPGPVDLFDVHVTDDPALAVDPNSDCPNPDVPDLAVGESFTYECSIGNLDGVSPFDNTATAIGTGPGGKQVTDTDPATVFPPPLGSTITQPPTTQSPGETLPVTGASFEELRGSAIAGVVLFATGVLLLSGAALVGRLREDQ